MTTSVAALSPALGTVDRMRIGPSTEATFVAGRHGRDGALLLWERSDGSSAPADDRIERRGEATVVLADGPGPATRNHHRARDERGRPGSDLPTGVAAPPSRLPHRHPHRPDDPAVVIAPAALFDSFGHQLLERDR